MLQAFLVLFLLIGGHTMLETARDALFLTKLPPKELNLVYIALAGLSFLAAAGGTRLAARFGRRNALIGTLCIAALSTTVLHSMSPTPRAVMTLYVMSGLIGAVLSPQFWMLTAQLFTSAQGRRLFGPIASGGVIGGVGGAGSAALLLTRLPVTSLLLFAAFAFIGAALLLTTVTPSQEGPGPTTRIEPGRTSQPRSTRPPPPPAGQAFVWHVALLVGLSTGTVLTVDYLFKSTAAHTIPAPRLGEFFARYYAMMNAVSLVVQLFVASRVVRRLGVAAATGVTPFLMLLGAIASFLSGGRLIPVLAMRLVDGALRHSLSRVATELLYLPMPASLRERAKGLIDTVLTRSVQATVAGALFAVSTFAVLSPRILALVVVVMSVSWLAVAIALRTPYLDLFRGALARGTLAIGDEGSEIDVNAAEALVEAMAHPEPSHVVAALDVLEQRHRTKLIPALILYHDAESVLLRALDIFGRSTRDDWIPLGERLLAHAAVPIRVGAVRALAKRGVASALARAADDESSAVQGYAAYHLALGAEGDLAADLRLAAMVEEPGPSGHEGRRVLLTAIADAPDPRAISLVLAIVHSPVFDDAELDVMLAARAMEALPDARYVPYCVARLARRPGRDAIREALVAIGDPALTALEAALDDGATSRRVRVHVPWTIAGYGTQRACDQLVACLTRDNDGFIRYKALRGLGHIVATTDVTVDKRAIEDHAHRTLVDHLRLKSLRLAVSTGGGNEDAKRALRLLVGLLQDKEDQALERAFRLLKIAYKREDIHRVHHAAVSNDKRARSNAGEFLDTLLSRRRQRELRTLFRLVVDDLAPAASVARAASFLESIPRDRDTALDRLIADRDDAIATLASYYGLALGADQLRAAVDRAGRDRPSLASLIGRFSVPVPLGVDG